MLPLFRAVLKYFIIPTINKFMMMMMMRAVPVSVSVALGHEPVNAVKATAGACPLVAPRV